MADGKGCKCAAYDQSECGCDADWTPQEVYDLRAENANMREMLRRKDGASIKAVPLITIGSEIVPLCRASTLTDAEREAIGYAASIVRLSGKRADRIRSDVMTALLARFE